MIVLMNRILCEMEQTGVTELEKYDMFFELVGPVIYCNDGINVFEYCSRFNTFKTLNIEEVLKKSL